MKKSLKKLLSLFLVLATVLSCFPIGVSAGLFDRYKKDVKITVKADKRRYDLGEIVTFTVKATNKTDEVKSVKIKVDPKDDDLFSYDESFWIENIPANSDKTVKYCMTIADSVTNKGWWSFDRTFIRTKFDKKINIYVNRRRQSIGFFIEECVDAANLFTPSITGAESAVAGSTVTYTYYVQGENMAAFQGSITYNTSQLEYVADSAKTAFTATGYWMLNANPRTGEIVFTLEDVTQTSTLSGKTALFTVQFRIKSGVAAGTNIAVKATELDVIVKDDSAPAGYADAKMASTTVSCTTTVVKVKDKNPNLKSLIVGTLSGENITLSSAFSAAVTTYTANVAYSISKVTIITAAELSTTTVSIFPDPSDTTLTAGEETSFTIKCTAEDGTTKIYTVRIKRAEGDNTEIDLNEYDWEHICYVGYDAIYYGGNDSAVEDNITAPAGREYAKLFGWIACSKPIKAFYYTIDGGEKVYDTVEPEGGLDLPDFKFATTDDYLAAPMGKTDKYGNYPDKDNGGVTRFYIIAKIETGTQLIEAYVEYEDGTSELFWAVIATRG